MSGHRELEERDRDLPAGVVLRDSTRRTATDVGGDDDRDRQHRSGQQRCGPGREGDAHAGAFAAPGLVMPLATAALPPRVVMTTA